MRILCSILLYAGAWCLVFIFSNVMMFMCCKYVHCHGDHCAHSPHHKSGLGKITHIIIGSVKCKKVTLNPCHDLQVIQVIKNAERIQRMMNTFLSLRSYCTLMPYDLNCRHGI